MRKHLQGFNIQSIVSPGALPSEFSRVFFVTANGCLIGEEVRYRLPRKEKKRQKKLGVYGKL